MRTHRNDRAYVRKREALQRQARRNNSPCHLCGRPFDWAMLDALGKDGWKHPLSFTADHLDAVNAGGSMVGQLAPAH